MKRLYLVGALVAAISVVAYGATTFTTNYSFNKPGDRDKNYGSLIRDNWDRVDSLIKSNEVGTLGHLNDTTDAHEASAIKATAGSFLCTTSTDVQDYLTCLDGTLDPGTSGIVLIAGSQTITGAKTFSVPPTFSSIPSGILNTNGIGEITASTFGTLDPLISKGDLLVYSTDSTRLAVGSDGQQLYADSASSEGVKWDNPNPRWRKFTYTYTDFSAGATSFSVTAFALAANEGIDAVVLHHSAAFTGGSATAYTFEVGVSGNTDKYLSPADVFQAADNTTRELSNVLDVPNFGTTTDVVVTAKTTGDNLDQITAGSVDIWVRTFLLP